MRRRGRLGGGRLTALALAVVLVAGGVVLIRVPGRSYAGPFGELTPEERSVLLRLQQHVHHLAGTIGERHLWEPRRLEAAATYLEGTFRAAGLPVVTQSFTVEGERVRNVEAERAGGALRDEIVVVGAHYDSVVGSPGANDNATGVAALLELAARFAPRTPARTVRFVGFVNEEPPFFQTPGMGSLVYARRSRERRETIVGMLALETIGCYRDTPGSQQYPAPFGLFFPHTGNFVAFVANLRSRGLVRRVVDAFRRQTAFPSEGAAAPGWIPGIGWSDHWAFWRAGYRAVMITDTALFRYPHYHAPTDTPDKIQYDRLARVVEGLDRVLQELAGGG